MTERLYAGLSAEQRSARRREQFLTAGLATFAERGWSDTTVQDVCRAAALSPRYFYELFSSREDLFLAVTGRIAEQVEQTVRSALSAPAADPRARAHAVLTALAGYFTSDARTVRVALVESLATEQLRVHRRELLESFHSLAARLMRALREDPSRAARRRLEQSAAVLTGGVVELLIAWEGDPAGTPLLVDHLTDLYTAAAQL